MTATYTPHHVTLEEAYGELELHINDGGELPKLFGKAIKASGGRYSECRGNRHTRYVHIRTSKPELIDTVCRLFMPRTIILRGACHLMSDLKGLENSQFGRGRQDEVIGRFDRFKDNAVAALELRINTTLTDAVWSRANWLAAERVEIAKRDAERNAGFRRASVLAERAEELLGLLSTLSVNNQSAAELVDSVQSEIAARVAA